MMSPFSKQQQYSIECNTYEQIVVWHTDTYFFIEFVVVLIGDSGVGKTNFLTRYAWDQFTHESRTTIGIDFACRDVQHESKKIKLQVWDTAGQERFRVLAHL